MGQCYTHSMDLNWYETIWTPIYLHFKKQSFYSTTLNMTMVESCVLKITTYCFLNTIPDSTMNMCDSGSIVIVFWRANNNKIIVFWRLTNFWQYQPLDRNSYNFIMIDVCELQCGAAMGELFISLCADLHIGSAMHYYIRVMMTVFMEPELTQFTLQWLLSISGKSKT